VGSTNFQLSISFSGSYIPDPNDAAPIMITATDTNGESASSWFLLTVSSINQPPTNSLTSLPATNTLANTTLKIPFMVGSARNPSYSLTYSVASNNNTVIPAGNIVIGNTGTANPTVSITPAAGQVGNATVSVTVYDNDPDEPRSTTANVAVIVRPNTNIVAIDYFNYDSRGSLDTIGGYWSHLSGIAHQMQVSGGTVTISGGNTENLQAQLLGSPFKTNSGTVLYSSFTVNVDPSQMPVTNGSYIVAFNDGSGNTADVEDCLVVSTNGASANHYRLGIDNVVGANGATATMFTQDLQPGVPYFVVTALSLTNGYSTLWVAPSNQFSASVTDTTPPATPTNLYNIVNIELRESGATEGTIYIGSLLVGTTFNSVFYPPQANLETFGVTENTTNLLGALPYDGGSELSLLNVSETDGNGTATASGTNVSFIPAANFQGAATINYTVKDDVGNTSSSTITVTVTNNPPLAVPVAYTVMPNSVNNVLNPLTNDVLETPGGSLSLVSLSETDGNGTAVQSGNQVLFTPANNFTGTATISYTITDNVGGTNSSVITVAVLNPIAIPLNAALAGNTKLIMSWTNPALSLQFSTNVAGPYVTIPGATSPYTNLTTTNAADFFRLWH
jgi:hypothetical protein